MSNIVDKVFDNTEDGKPNYAIQLVDGTRLYCRGQVLNPLPQSGDAIDFTVINVKTSDKGNQYTNVKDVTVAHNHTLDALHQQRHLQHTCVATHHPHAQHHMHQHAAMQRLNDMVNDATLEPLNPVTL